MDEELRSLQLDKWDKRGKSTEQIKRHSLDPSIENKPVEKALHLLVKGDEVQKISVVQSLPQLMKIDSQAAFTRVLPRIQQELTHSSTEFHVTTSHMFQFLIESQFKTEGNITGTVLQGIDSKDPVVANAWLETLLEVIPILPMKVIQSEVLPLACIKGQCAQSVPARISSSKILGKIVLHPQMKPIEIKKDVLPIVHGLCQDINYNVRAAICEQLPAISRGLGAGMIKNSLLSNLVELSSDDNANVRAKAISSVVQVMPYLDKETKHNTMVPLVMQMCNSILGEYESVILAKEMGLLLTSLETCVTNPQADILISFYQQIAKRGLDSPVLSVHKVDLSQDVKTRQHCAANFPAVAAFTLSSGTVAITTLYDTFKALAFDPCYIVRQTVAGVFHEVAQILGGKNSIMKHEFVRLLRDDAEEVLQMLIPHISASMVLFMQHGTLNVERTDSVSNDFGKALLKCFAQLKKGYNWRLTTIFLKQLETLPVCFRCEQIHNEFTPPIVQCCVAWRTKPVRSQASRTLLVFMRWNIRMVQRTWLRDHLITELGENKCSYTRHVFIDMCTHAIDLYSNKFFKENFYTPLLRLSTDRVSTVRYRMVNLLPKLRRMIRLPQDRKLLQSLEQVILQIEKSEKDRDVLSNLIAKTKEMMTPILQSSQEESDATERRLIEEEDDVNKGKISINVQLPDLTANKIRHESGGFKRIRSASASRPPTTRRISATSSSTSSSRSTSVPRQTSGASREIISGMTILNQHFYVDAGVNLPIEEVNQSGSKETSETDQSENQSTGTVNKTIIDITDDVDNLSLQNDVNMTDDVKVNMRRKSQDKSKRNSSEIPTAIMPSPKNKRHSSANVDFSLVNSPNLRRRSLNIQSKEISKIPLILKSVENFAVCESQDTKLDESVEHNKKVKRLSNLPVPIRRK